MRIIRWHPFQLLDSSLWDTPFETLKTRAVLPSTLSDIYLEQTKDAIILTAQLRGVKPDRVKIDATPTTVTLSGEQCNQDFDSFHQRTSYKRFQRTIPLPERIQDDQILIETFQDTVRLILPKRQGGEPRSIFDPFNQSFVSDLPRKSRSRTYTLQRNQAIQDFNLEPSLFNRNWNRAKHWLGNHLRAIADKLLE